MARQIHTQQRTNERLALLRSGFAAHLAAFRESQLFTGPSVHFHTKAIARLAQFQTPGAAVQDDEFVDLVYATLTAWGMHRMGPKGAKLTEIDRFRAGLRRHAPALDALSALRIGDCAGDQASVVAGRLWRIIEDLDVTASATKLVAGTKALHHVLPELVPPMDREYTIRFFFHHKTLNRGDQAAFLEMFPHLCVVARDCRATIDAARGVGAMSASAGKIIDNAIVGFVLAQLKQSDAEEESEAAQ